MSKYHIRRADERHFAVSLCGLTSNRKYMVMYPDDATCQRCIKLYADNNSWHATLEERVAEVTKGPEVRTTSSTGGQKGVKEQRYSLIPTGPLAELAVLFGRGARKYAPHQWRQGYEWSKSIDAIHRHTAAFWSGKDYDVCSNDPEGCQHVDAEGNPFEPPAPDTCYNHTGVHHMTAVAWHSFVLLEFKDNFPEHDDRFIFDRKDEIVFYADDKVMGYKRVEE